MPRSQAVRDANVIIYSWGIKDFNPIDVPFAYYSVNVTNLRDPIGQAHMVTAFEDGTAPTVVKWVKEDKRVPAILDTLQMITEAHLRAGKEQYITLAFYDYHGKWISPALAELTAERLDQLGYTVIVLHRSVKRA